jgi:hypothetical protein
MPFAFNKSEQNLFDFTKGDFAFNKSEQNLFDFIGRIRWKIVYDLYSGY